VARRRKLNDAIELDLLDVRPKDLRRFFSFVGKPTESGCWPWRGSTDENGYGQFWYNGKCVGAHRFSCALFRGAVEGGKQVHHNDKCSMHNCIHPNHVEPKTKLENASDGGKRRHEPAMV
jgi:hypothetical protein